MTPFTRSASAKRNIQRAPLFILQKRKIPQIRFSQSQTRERNRKKLRADGVVMAHQHLPHCLSLCIRIQKPDDTSKLAAQFSSHHVVEIQCYNTEKDLVYRSVIALLL